MNKNLKGLIKASEKIVLFSIPSLLISFGALASYAEVLPISSPLTRPPEPLTPKPPVKPTNPILNPSQLSSPKAPESKTPVDTQKQPTQTQPSQAPSNEVLIPIKRIDVLGSSLLTPAEIAALVAPLQNKLVTFSQLQEVTDKITQIYQDRNYITSRAVLAPQDVKDGVVTIQVREGTLERVDVKRAGDVSGRLNDNYIRDRILIAGSTPLNFTKLEDALQLLRSDPLIGDIRANLTTGSQANQSVLQVTFSEAKSFSIRPFFDDYGNPSTGIYRIGVNLQELNTTGNGDPIILGYIRSGSSDNYQFNYQYPINAKGGTIGFNFFAQQNPVTEPPFNTLNILTDSQTYQLTYRQPMIRSPREELAFGFSLAFENNNSFFGNRSFNFQNFKFDDGKSQARILGLSQDYVSRDTSGVWALRSTLNIGLNFLGATIRDDGSPDGRFFYWVGQLLRIQRLGSDNDTLVTFRLNTQLAGSPLLSVNRFSIGGPQSIRGYQQNQLTGDSGIQASVEFQFPLVRDSEGISLVKILPFIDAGTVWNSQGFNPNPQTLVGIGFGTTYQPIRNLILRFDYGIPLVNISNVSNNLQNSGLYFSVNANF
ncbi:MAG: ShlB/FhaC/HecB family hemolysin secretion/activation protein [Pseudanabaena sp.]|nr:MAG: ShlB/FhaC/HecB family hemolysin secretion/activation protein [Pseudanabaena sp.]